jgi:hypothetical protein
MGFATSWLSGLSNAGKPKHSFVIAVRRAKSIDKWLWNGSHAEEVPQSELCYQAVSHK